MATIRRVSEDGLALDLPDASLGTAISTTGTAQAWAANVPDFISAPLTELTLKQQEKRALAAALCAVIVLWPARVCVAGTGYDTGGNIRAYAADVSRLNRTGAKKVISGVCASACTMYLGVKNVCIEPDAEVWFHAAHLPVEHRPDPLGSLQMLSYYPKKVRAWAIQVGALEKTEWDGANVLTGRQLIGMGVARCRK
jgi:hypothetical protein